MARSYRHTPLFWYVQAGPDAMRFLRRYTAHVRRMRTRTLLAAARYDEIANWRPVRAIYGDAKEYAEHLSPYDTTVSQHAPGGAHWCHYQMGRRELCLGDPQLEQARDRRRWLRHWR